MRHSARRGEVISKVRQHFRWARARIDKMTLAAWQRSTFTCGERRAEIPAGAAATPAAKATSAGPQHPAAGRSGWPVEHRAARRHRAVGGLLPTAEMPTTVLAVKHASLSTEESASARLGRFA